MCEVKQSKKKGDAVYPLIGPWIHKLHVADNGIDITSSGDGECETETPHDDRHASLINCLQMIGKSVA